jgi:PAX-interacting protein 1
MPFNMSLIKNIALASTAIVCIISFIMLYRKMNRLEKQLTQQKIPTQQIPTQQIPIQQIPTHPLSSLSPQTKQQSLFLQKQTQKTPRYECKDDHCYIVDDTENDTKINKKQSIQMPQQQMQYQQPIQQMQYKQPIQQMPQQQMQYQQPIQVLDKVLSENQQVQQLMSLNSIQSQTEIIKLGEESKESDEKIDKDLQDELKDLE